MTFIPLYSPLASNTLGHRRPAPEGPEAKFKKRRATAMPGGTAQGITRYFPVRQKE